MDDTDETDAGVPGRGSSMLPGGTGMELLDGTVEETEMDAVGH